MSFIKQKTILRTRAYSVAFACVAMSSAGLSQTETPVLRDWNEVMLEAIRNDLARPNVHARNLYHFTEGIYHLQLRTEGAASEAIDSEVAVWPEDNEALLTIQNDEINFDHAVAAYGYRFIQLRYAQSPGWAFTLSNLITAFISSTSSTPNVLLSTSPAAAWGWACAEAINTAYQFDGANQDGDYDNITEEEFKRRMMSEIEPSLWVAPTYRSGKHIREPLQQSGIKTMGYLKPWAPAFSYGLVVRFDEDLKPIASYHSRTSGNFHGTTSVIVDKDQNILVTSKGDGKLGGWK